MENISLHGIEEVGEVREFLNTLKAYCDILGLYQKDPFQVASKFANGDYKFLASEEAEGSIKTSIEDFKEILKGINGDFTKSRAIEIGKNKILRYIEEHTIELVSEYSELKSVIKLPLETILSNMKILNDVPFDTVAFERRKAIYTGPLAAKEFMSKKLMITISNELGANLDVKTVLNTLLTVVGQHEVAKGFENLNKYIEIYKAKLSLLKLQNEQNETNLVEIAKDTEFNVAEYGISIPLAIIYDANKTVTEDPNITDLDLLGHLSDTVESYQSRITEDTNTFSAVMENFSSIDDNFQSFLEEFKERAIVKFAETVITSDEFVTLVEKYMFLLLSSIVLERNIFVEIYKEAFELNKSISMFNTIFTFVDKVTSSGTVGLDKK